MGYLTCAAPGCDRVLHPRNRSRVCRDHNHSAWCRCAQCSQRHGLPPPPDPVTPSRVEVRRVQIPVFTTCSNVPGYAYVSLPREPWEVRP